MKVAVGLRRVAAGKRTSGRRAAQIAAEGSVNKIKVIKRIMYGRSSFDLLKAKVLFHELFHIEIN